MRGLPDRRVRRAVSSSGPPPASTVSRVRYLVASDLHYSLPQLDWIHERAGDFDAVVLAGDLLDTQALVDIGAQIALVSPYLQHLADETRVVVCSGNHDLTARRTDGEKSAAWLQSVDPRVVTDGAALRIGDDLISACAWWEGPATRAELELQLERDAAVARSGRWIWAYHSPPDRSPTSWSGHRNFGDDVLNGLIERHRPDVVLAGHVHEAPFVPDGCWFDRIGQTVVLNAGRQPGPVPAHLVLDTGTAEVTWSSYEGEGTEALGALA